MCIRTVLVKGRVMDNLKGRVERSQGVILISEFNSFNKLWQMDCPKSMLVVLICLANFIWPFPIIFLVLPDHDEYNSQFNS